MLPYVVLTFLAMVAIAHGALALGCNKFRIHPYITLVPLILTAILISGLRYQTGGDWQVYEQWFNGFTFDEILKFSVEPGWIIYSIIIREIGFDFNSYLLVTSVLSNFLIWKGLHDLLRDRRIAIICFGFYCLIAFYSTQMFYIRSGLAAGLFLCAIALSRQSKLHAFLIFVAAVSVHNAAALAAIIYLCMHEGMRNRFWLLLSILTLGVLFSFTSMYFLPQVYVEGPYADARSLSVKTLFGLMLLFTVVLKFDDFKKQFSPEAVAVSIAALTVPYLFDSFEVGGRLRMFFSPMDGVPIYFMVSLFVSRLNAVIPLLIASGLFIFIYWSNDYVVELFIPYKTWIINLF